VTLDVFLALLLDIRHFIIIINRYYLEMAKEDKKNFEIASLLCFVLIMRELIIDLCTFFVFSGLLL